MLPYYRSCDGVRFPIWLKKFEATKHSAHALQSVQSVKVGRTLQFDQNSHLDKRAR